jgi:hypothetical protein
MRLSEEAAGRTESELVGGERGEAREREGEDRRSENFESWRDSRAIAPSRWVPAGGPSSPAPPLS